MDWILDNLQIVIAIAAAIAYWLNRHKQDSSEEDEGGGGYPTRNVDDSQDAARARRIQEEIRRKIAERTGMPPMRHPEPADELPPLFHGESSAPPPMIRPLQTHRENQLRDDAEMSSVLERQQKLREQMEALERTRRKQTYTMKPATAAVAPVVTVVGGSLQDDLRQKNGLRRAILLREVLGPPVGLR